MSKFYANVSAILNLRLTSISCQRLSCRCYSNLVSDETATLYKRGLFVIESLKTYKGLYLLQQNVNAGVEHLVVEALSTNRSRKLVEIFDELSDCICRVADMADFLRLGHPDGYWRNAAFEVHSSISDIVERLNTNFKLYETMKKVVERGDRFPTDEVDRNVSKLFLSDFEKSGIFLPQDRRTRFVELNDQILHIGSNFLHNVHSPTSFPVEYLPEVIKQGFGVSTGTLKLSSPCSEDHSELKRESGYKIFYREDPHQLELLNGLLKARYEQANLVGFDSFSHRSLMHTMAESPDVVLKFLTSLSEKIMPFSKKDVVKLTEIKQSLKDATPSLPSNYSGHPNETCVWDVSYLTAIKRNRDSLMADTEIAAYFPLDRVMDGLHSLFNSIYGVSLHTSSVFKGELWHQDVFKYAVVEDASNTLLGYIYCDLFERPDKPHQDCHFTIRGGRRLSSSDPENPGGYQMPVVVLMLNFPKVLSPELPSLLTHDMLTNLFHEFGHAMHSMLARTRYQHVTGTRCSTDFAELPSVLMEYFANDPRVLQSIAFHAKSGEPLDSEIIQSICRESKTFAAIDMQKQIFYSILDQMYHGDLTDPSVKNLISSSPLNNEKSPWTTELLRAIQSEYYPIEYVDKTAWQLRFGHLVGYGAKYYSYLWSRALASKVWKHCFEEECFNRRTGSQFKEKVLAHGGGLPPSKLMENLIGESVTPDDLVESLVDEIDHIYNDRSGDIDCSEKSS